MHNFEYRHQAALRRGLVAGEPFADLLEAAGLTLRPEALVPFARWMPPTRRSHAFDTRFFLAAAPSRIAVSVDGAESSEACWISAAAMLERHRLGEAAVIFPTRANLSRLAEHDSFAALVAHAASVPVRLLMTVHEERDGQTHLSVPPGYGYPPLTEVREPRGR